MAAEKRKKNDSGSGSQARAPAIETTARKTILLACFGIVAAVFFAYSNSFNLSFQFDDTHTVQSNMYVRSLRYVPLYFQDARTYSYRPENSGYRPMSTLACALAFQLSGLETWGYHLIKLAEHAAVAILVFLLGLRLLPVLPAAHAPRARFWAALFGAMIFALHRANTETVDYITAISTLQAGLFLLLGFYFYLRFREQSGRRKWWWLAGSSFVYLLSMMSKEEGITLPGVILAYEWIYGCPPDQAYVARLRMNFMRWTRWLIPYVAMALLFIALRACIQPVEADKSRGNISHYVYFITQLRAWFHYWKLFAWPVTLNSDNLAFGFSQGLDDWRVWACGAFHVAVWAAAWRYGRKHRFGLFAIAWFYITILPASSFFPLVEAVNEHRMYIPYMMAAPLASWLLFRFATKRGLKTAIAAATVVSLLLGAGAFARNRVWQTDVSLWEDVLAKNPDSPRALNVLAISLIDQGELGRSVQMLERCHRLVPTYLPCIVHLSIAYSHLKRFKEGLAVLEYGYRVDPDYPHLNFHLGLYYKDYFGDFEKAVPYFKRVRELTAGRFYQATLKLADIDIEEGHLDEALTLVNSVLDTDLTNGDAWDGLGRIKVLRGNFMDARNIFKKLIEAVPNSPRYVVDGANLAERAHDNEQARSLFAHLVEINPMAIQGWQGLARLARAQGDLKAAAEAQAKIDDLLRTREWYFIPSALLVGEKPRQTAP